MSPTRQVLKRYAAEQAHTIDKMQKLVSRAVKRYPDPKDTNDWAAWEAVRHQRRQWITKHAPPAPVYSPYQTRGTLWPSDEQQLNAAKALGEAHL